MKKSRRIILMAVAATLLIGGGTFYALQRAGDPEYDWAAEQNINLEPATEADKKAADKNKQDIVKEQEEAGRPASLTDKKSVTPIVSSAVQRKNSSQGNVVEVRAFIPDVYESGGSCKATFNKTTESFSRQVEALKDATTTRCDVVTVAREDFPSTGSWTVAVTYNSPSSSGTSKQVTVEVQ